MVTSAVEGGDSSATVQGDGVFVDQAEVAESFSSSVLTNLGVDSEWSGHTATSEFAVNTSNQLTGVASAARWMAHVQEFPANEPQYVECDYIGGSVNLVLCWDGDTSADDRYEAHHDGGTRWLLRKVTGGSYSTLQDNTSGASSPSRMRLYADDTGVYWQADGVTQASSANTDYRGGRAGVRLDNASAIIDTFEAGTMKENLIETASRVDAEGPAMVGGTVTDDLVNGYRYHTITADETLVVNRDIVCDWLLVGGGGGAPNGNYSGAGGGALPKTGTEVTLAAGSYPVVIGVGGVTGTTKGGNSTFDGNTSYGGGGGALSASGGGGGSSGGTSAQGNNASGTSGGAAPTGGYAGGDGTSANSGGGGGAGQAGWDGTTNAAGHGGRGVSWLDGNWYGGGGGGHEASSKGGSGGRGGGGNRYGGGTDGTGGGAGGRAAVQPGEGGDGVFKIRYRIGL